MTNEEEIKLLRLQVELDDHLRDVVPQKGARRFLLEEVINSPAAKAHIKGTLPAPDLRELADEVWATKGGQRLREVLEQGDAAKEADAAVKRNADLHSIENMSLDSRSLQRQINLSRSGDNAS